MRRESEHQSLSPQNGHHHRNGQSENSDSSSSGADDEQIFINPSDGLRLSDMDEVNGQIHLARLKLAEIGVDVLNLDLSNLSLEEWFENSNTETAFPTSLIVTGLVDEGFWEDGRAKLEFEEIFKGFEPGRRERERDLALGAELELGHTISNGDGDGSSTSSTTFYYFKSFKRVRVDFESATSCITARIKVHMSSFGNGNVLKCYFGQPMKSKSKDGFLHPPTPDKQFLISPPASPPVDWEPHPEGHPVLLDYDLISALAKLGPGDSHELHKPESESHPSIVVHIAEEDDSEEARLYKEGLQLLKTGGNPSSTGNSGDIPEITISGAKIQPTRRPE